MSHSDVLKLLIPLEVSGDYAADLALEGKVLDAGQTSADILLDETLPTTAYALLVEWEKLTATSPETGEPLISRRARVTRKLQELGDIKKPYFVGLALTLGYQIYIQEYLPTMADWAEAGDELIVPDDERILFIWNVHIFNQSVYHFHAGQSAAGERLTWWKPAAELESVMDELRPAHVHLIFSYE